MRFCRSCSTLCFLPYPLTPSTEPVPITSYRPKTLVAIGVALTIIGFILLFLEQSGVIGPIIL